MEARPCQDAVAELQGELQGQIQRQRLLRRPGSSLQPPLLQPRAEQEHHPAVDTLLPARSLCPHPLHPRRRPHPAGPPVPRVPALPPELLGLRERSRQRSRVGALQGHRGHQPHGRVHGAKLQLEGGRQQTPLRRLHKGHAGGVSRHSWHHMGARRLHAGGQELLGEPDREGAFPPGRQQARPRRRREDPQDLELQQKQQLCVWVARACRPAGGGAVEGGGEQVPARLLPRALLQPGGGQREGDAV
mmetsp:Transcript_47969/g.119933  ORF Transcript_47969/g.119933 Transcript_47969/m.119933 type:complete len:246 (-) Transcript_47969:1230-1967(-)